MFILGLCVTFVCKRICHEKKDSSYFVAVEQPKTVEFKGSKTEQNLKDAFAGEAAQCGGYVYTNVVGTLNITASGEKVSITSGDTEIVMYNYSNAKFYQENYQALEALNGKEVKVTLVAYNWYQTQYTYIITSCEAL